MLDANQQLKVYRGNISDISSLRILAIPTLSQNLDDFESGIFEAMASGCVVISERLYEKTLKDLNMSASIIQIDSPRQLKEKLKLLKSNPEIISSYLEKSKLAIQNNTWHDRAQEMCEKFREVCNE